MNKRHYAVTILLLTALTGGFFCTSPDPQPPIRDQKGNAFAGSAACSSCHKDIYASHINTAHSRDSKPAATEYIKGNFDTGAHQVIYDDGTAIILTKEKNRFFQTASKNGKPSRQEPFDIVIGSGRKGQSYLWWNDSRLRQLPVSFFTPLQTWCNSPGYPVNTPFFDRPVPAYCMECHSTYAATIATSNTDNEDRFDKTRIILGIECEKCHGSAAEHVKFHQANPGQTIGKYIVNTSRLGRQQRLDACALCHSGSRYPLKPAFSFTAGDRLNDFSQPKYMPDSVASLDVHANQYGLLTSSKCFLYSQMDCSSCHNPHANEAGLLKVVSERCLSCHRQPAHDSCSMPPTPGLVLTANCIDCHMPKLPSRKILLKLADLSAPDRPIPNMVRTHHIGIYPQATKDYLKQLSAAKPSNSAHP